MEKVNYQVVILAANIDAQEDDQDNPEVSY
jgi:hypothetical protein